MNQVQPFKRKLTCDEIRYILGSLKSELYSVNNLPVNMKENFFEHFFQPIVKSLKKIQLYPQAIPEFVEILKKKYILVTPGKSVGIITGQSIGEMQTQTTLNTFHKAGLTEKTVVTGVPRFLEIIDTNRSETQSTPSCYVYFRSRPSNVREAREIVGSELCSISFSKLLLHYQFYENQIIYEMDLELLYRYKITLEYIRLKILDSIKDLKVTIHISELHRGLITLNVNDVLEGGIFELENIYHNAIIRTHISGIPNIENMFFMYAQETKEWYIETDGSNLKEILHLDWVDSFRTYSNDIWEIYNLFGIEAIRSYIIFELQNLMPSIHSTHICILADRMTVSGKLRSITRYTRKNETSSVLSKATFEETLSHFLSAALNMETEQVNGSSANITCGKVPLVGTGMNELLI